jgi:cation transport ATPase
MTVRQSHPCFAKEKSKLVDTDSRNGQDRSPSQSWNRAYEAQGSCTRCQTKHPLGKAVINAARSLWGGDVTHSEKGVKVSEFQVPPGSGVECLVGKAHRGEFRVRVGTREWAGDDLDHESSSVIVNSIVGDREVTEIR